MSEIKTPWGQILTKVNLFPIYYLIFIYGFVYIFPFGENIVGTSWFYFVRKEDGILEYLQFFQYFISFIIGCFILFKIKKKKSLDFFRINGKKKYLEGLFYFILTRILG